MKQEAHKDEVQALGSAWGLDWPFIIITCKIKSQTN
jgi:hypothetical protein